MKKKFIISLLIASMLSGMAGMTVIADEEKLGVNEEIVEISTPEKESAPEPETAVTEKEEKDDKDDNKDKDDKDDKDADKDKDDQEEATAAPTASAEPEASAKPDSSASDSVKPEPTKKPEKEKLDKDNKKDKEDKDDKDDKDDNKAQTLENFRLLKKRITEGKKSAKAYIKEISGITKELSKELRKTILSDIAEIKKELNDDSIDALVNGSFVDFDKYDSILPVIESGRTLMPLRAVCETLGAVVDWNDKKKEITVSNGDTIIVLGIGNKVAYVNGDAKTIDAAPEIRGGRTLVPVRFIAESLGLTVDWDDESRSVLID